MPFIHPPSLSGFKSVGGMLKEEEQERQRRKERDQKGEKKDGLFFADSALFRGDGDGETILLALALFR